MWEAVPVMLQEGVVFFRSIDASSISELGNGRDEAVLTLKCRTDKTDIPTRILQTASLLGQNLSKLILSMFQEKASAKLVWLFPGKILLAQTFSILTQRDY